MDLKKVTERLKLLSEYNYYLPEVNEAPEDEQEDDELDLEDGDDLSDDEVDIDVASDEGGDDQDLEGEIEGSLDDMDMADEPMMDTEDEVELDITELVDGINQNAESITQVGQKVDSVTSKLSSQINQMIQNNQKIIQQIQNMGSSIDKEFKKRTPTPYEDIMMRSLSSYPYNQKLTDYWTAADGGEYDYSINNPQTPDTDTYDVKVKSKEDEKPKEYVLTQQDLEDDYNEADIVRSL